MDVAISVGHRVKIQGSEKMDKYLVLGRELKKKKLCNMTVTVVPSVVSALGKFSNTEGFGKQGKYPNQKSLFATLGTGNMHKTKQT